MSTANGFDLSTYRIDKGLSRDGAWFALQPFLDSRTIRLAVNDTEPAVRIAHASHPMVRIAINNCIQEERDKSGDAGNSFVAGVERATAQRIVTDWRHLPLDGGIVPYSPEKCLELLRDEELPEFMQFVDKCSSNLASFRKRVEAKLGN